MIDIDRIINKKFPRAFSGYDMRAVDLFLDAVIEKLEADEKERMDLMQAMDALLKELEEFDELRAEAERARFGVPSFTGEKSAALDKPENASGEELESAVSGTDN